MFKYGNYDDGIKLGLSSTFLFSFILLLFFGDSRVIFVFVKATHDDQTIRFLPRIFTVDLQG